MSDIHSMPCLCGKTLIIFGRIGHCSSCYEVYASHRVSQQEIDAYVRGVEKLKEEKQNEILKRMEEHL